MFRLLILLLALMLLPACSMAEAPAPLTFTDDLTGVYTWPEGSSEAEASYVYRYTYPQIAGDSELALTINEVFRYEADDAVGFECPMNASAHDPALGQMEVIIAYEIVHLSDEFLSVRVDKQVTVGETASSVVKGYSFMLTGVEAGTVTSLPYLLGVIDPEDTDEWYLDRQTAKADACARDLVWMRIEQDMKAEGSPIYEDMTFEEFEWGFYPEEDFYLDAEGNFVFFLQEGMIAPVEDGQFFYAIPLDELLDEI